MTANELADYLDKCVSGNDNDVYKQAVNMLRRQQDEIEALKNAKRFIQNFAEEQHQRAIALEMRELTDEEIKDIGMQSLKDTASLNWNLDAINLCARAILKKASEK